MSFPCFRSSILFHTPSGLYSFARHTQFGFIFFFAREKNFHIESLDKQITQYTQELTLLRKQNSQLDQDYHEKEKALMSLKTKFVVAEQEIKEKNKLLEKQQELWKVANEQKTFLEESLNERDSQLQRKQIAIQNMSADLMKSNEIITKLQTDLAANKAKVCLSLFLTMSQNGQLIFYQLVLPLKTMYYTY